MEIVCDEMLQAIKAKFSNVAISDLSGLTLRSFSDDDLGNIKAVEEIIREELYKKFPDINFVIYDTSYTKNIKKKRIFIEGKFTFAIYGADSAGSDFGKNIFVKILIFLLQISLQISD